MLNSPSPRPQILRAANLHIVYSVDLNISLKKCQDILFRFLRYFPTLPGTGLHAGLLTLMRSYRLRTPMKWNWNYRYNIAFYFSEMLIYAPFSIFADLKKWFSWSMKMPAKYVKKIYTAFK